VEKFRPALMDAIYQWSKGASFGTICEVTDIMEGSIIRYEKKKYLHAYFHLIIHTFSKSNAGLSGGWMS
jgi:hypothetical protein